MYPPPNSPHLQTFPRSKNTQHHNLSPPTPQPQDQNATPPPSEATPMRAGGCGLAWAGGVKRTWWMGTDLREGEVLDRRVVDFDDCVPRKHRCVQAPANTHAPTASVTLLLPPRLLHSQPPAARNRARGDASTNGNARLWTRPRVRVRVYNAAQRWEHRCSRRREVASEEGGGQRWEQRRVQRGGGETQADPGQRHSNRTAPEPPPPAHPPPNFSESNRSEPNRSQPNLLQPNRSQPTQSLRTLSPRTQSLTTQSLTTKSLTTQSLSGSGQMYKLPGCIAGKLWTFFFSNAAVQFWCASRCGGAC